VLSLYYAVADFKKRFIRIKIAQPIAGLYQSFALHKPIMMHLSADSFIKKNCQISSWNYYWECLFVSVRLPWTHSL